MAHSLPSDSSEETVVFRIFPDERRPWRRCGRKYLIPRWEPVELDCECKSGAILKTHKDLGIPYCSAAAYKKATDRLATDRQTSIAKYGELLYSDRIWYHYIVLETKRRDNAAAAINRALHADEMKAWERRRHALAAWRF